MSVTELVSACIAILLIGALVGYVLRLESHHCPPPLSLSEQESHAVATFKASLRRLPDQPHHHVFPDTPARSEHGWQTWVCLACDQEYTSRAARIKPEAGIV